MDNTSRMTMLLGELRRERNGAASDSMSFRGKPCGLNLGVAIPTIRSIASAVGGDHAFARYLYVQDVRELRIAAFWIADAAMVSEPDFDFWASGIVNSEIAELAAMSLFSRVKCVDSLLEKWCAESEILCYAALMSAARNEYATISVVLSAVSRVLERFPDSRLAGYGATAAVMKVFEREPLMARDFVSCLAVHGAAANYLREEAEWRME